MSTTATPDTAPAGASPWRGFASSRDGILALAAVAAIAAHLLLRLGPGIAGWPAEAPLIAVTLVAGVPLTIDVVKGAIAARGGADLLAAVSIITAVALGEWLVATIIVLMLSGGEALEEAASKRASATLDALARRSPTVAHRLRGDTAAAGFDDIHVDEVAVGDLLLVMPHELCPVDGEVLAGRGAMDESYLTGEPYVIPKSAGSEVISGAVNAEAALTVRAGRTARDSRYAQIVGVLKEAEENRPPMRRLADRMGAWYTLVAVGLGLIGWLISGDPSRFLAVVVIATPCPLLIGVPVAIIGAISLSARSGIIIKNPAMLEDVGQVRTVVFDKTGTLTYGRPALTGLAVAEGVDADAALAAAAAVEGYSRHPLARAVVDAAEERGLAIPEVGEVAERPGRGLAGTAGGHAVHLTNRAGLAELDPAGAAAAPERGAGLESVLLLDGRYAATMTFTDEPRGSAREFISHLPRHHRVSRTMILSGDGEAEVARLAGQVGIDEVHGSMSPEDKLAVVRDLEAAGPCLFLGDGINDAPAMTAASAGVAFGATSDVTMEAADAVVLDSSLERLDDLLHIGSRMRRIALQSVIGGMGLSVIGMLLAVFGLLTPLMGAIAQELIDILAILNAARVAMVRGPLGDFDAPAEVD